MQTRLKRGKEFQINRWNQRRSHFMSLTLKIVRIWNSCERLFPFSPSLNSLLCNADSHKIPETISRMNTDWIQKSGNSY